MHLRPFALVSIAVASVSVHPARAEETGIDYSAAMLEEEANEPGLPRFTVSAGGGLTSFVDTEVRTYVRSGGYWAVRGGLPLTRHWQLEATYTGSAQGIKGDGAADVTLLGHGVEGTLRWGFPIDARKVSVEPFAFVGFGFTWFKFTGTSNERPNRLGSGDLIGVLPAGVGVALRHKRWFVDLRGTFRYTMDDNALVFKPARSQKDQTYAPLDHVTVGGVLGRAF